MTAKEISQVLSSNNLKQVKIGMMDSSRNDPEDTEARKVYATELLRIIQSK